MAIGADRDLGAVALPSGVVCVRLYCARTRGDSLSHRATYLAFNLFRFAAIVHGINGRMIRGNAASAEAGGPVSQLVLFAGKAREIAEGMERV